MKPCLLIASANCGGFFVRYSFLIPVLWSLYLVTRRNVKFKSKTSPKNANFCNKTNPTKSQ